MLETKVLDHGYVRLVDKMGSDLSVVNAARVSFNKESTEFSGKDAKLIAFLAKNGHMSPFRHATMTFEIYAPLMTARQWFKYVVGHAQDPLQSWNESSRRYVTEEPEFYTPKWRESPENKKQGSGERLRDPLVSAKLNQWMSNTVNHGVMYYESAIEMGIAPEQARVFLPAYAMYVRWRWTCSLQGAVHLVQQRIKEDAQWEFQQYALAIYGIIKSLFPVSVQELLRDVTST